MYSKEMVLPVIIILSASIAVGISSFTFLNSFVSDIAIPGLIILMNGVSRSNKFNVLGNKLSFIGFLSSLIVYVLILLSMWVLYKVVKEILKKTGREHFEEAASSEDPSYAMLNNIPPYMEMSDSDNMPEPPEILDMGVTDELDMSGPDGMAGAGFGNFADYSA